jgi:acyl dehydratase
MSDIAVGQPIGPHAISSVSPHHMKTVAALLNDPVPIHFDRDAVEGLGLGNRLINQGPINVAYVLEMVSRFAGGHAHIRRFTVRLMGSVYEGDRVLCTGTVTQIDAEARSATLELQATVDSVPVLSASALVALAP